jgi:hypothetical protein
MSFESFNYLILRAIIFLCHIIGMHPAPLIFIHIPKTAGTSVKQIFRKWYGQGLHMHYYNEQAGGLPVKHDLQAFHSIERPVVIYGHFNRLRGFGMGAFPKYDIVKAQSSCGFRRIL